MIQGIFYARFLPQEGTKIVAQSPPGCIVASPSPSPSPSADADAPSNVKPPLLDFDIIQEYVIPRKAFFNRFVTVSSPDDRYTVLGFPVSIPNERYHRNEFLFNFGLVVEADVDQIPYERLVRRLAVIFAEMERQSGYLSSEGTAAADADGRRPIESLLEIIKEDLNNYGECMIPIDEANTLNMKLFPYQAAPAAVRGWHVPVPKMKLADIVDPTWDLTLQKIIPHVDGVNDVRRVAWLADVSLPLAQVALRHLLYYDTVLLLDMFFFGSCYAPRPGIHDFVANRDGLVDECAAYVCVRPPSPSSAPTAKSSTSGARKPSGGKTAAVTEDSATTKSEEGAGKRSNNNNNNNNGAATASTTANTTTTEASPQPTTKSTAKPKPKPEPPFIVTHYQLIKLMTTFCVGRSVMEWVKLHRDGGFDVLRHVDVRRLVQFGVIKGLLYRVHKYAVSKRYLAQLATGQVQVQGQGQATRPQASRRRDSSTAAVASSPSSSSQRHHGNGSTENPPAAAAAAERGSNSSSSSKNKKSVGGGRGGGGGGSGSDNTRAPTAIAIESSDNPLRKYLDGTHCFDEIITEQNMTDVEIMEKLKSFHAPPGDLAVFYR